MKGYMVKVIIIGKRDYSDFLIVRPMGKLFPDQKEPPVLHPYLDDGRKNPKYVAFVNEVED